MVDVLLTHSNHLYYDRKQVRKMQPYPPLQTLLAAACLRREGYEVALFDPALAPPEEGFEQALARHRPRLVAVCEDNFNFLTKMCLLRNRELAVWMARAARSAGVPAIVNGSDASDRAAEYLGAGFSYVLEGEVEDGIVEVARLILSGGTAPGHELRGIAFSDPQSGEIRHTPRRAPIADLDSLPMPAWDLIDAEPYRQAWTAAHGYFSLNMVSSRGCPYHCNWCAKPIWGDTYHCRSARLVAEEMLELKTRFQPDHLWFADDIFALSPHWTLEFADAVESLGAQIPFKMQSRCDLMTRPTVASTAPRRLRRGLDGRGVRRRRTCWTRWIKVRGSGRFRRPARTCDATASAPASSCSSAIPARRGRTSKRPSRWSARRGPTISAFRFPIRCRARHSTRWSPASSARRRIGPTATIWT